MHNTLIFIQSLPISYIFWLIPSFAFFRAGPFFTFDVTHSGLTPEVFLFAAASAFLYGIGVIPVRFHFIAKSCRGYGERDFLKKTTKGAIRKRMLKMSLARVSSYVRGVRHLGADSHSGWHVRVLFNVHAHRSARARTSTLRAHTYTDASS